MLDSGVNQREWRIVAAISTQNTAKSTVVLENFIFLFIGGLKLFLEDRVGRQVESVSHCDMRRRAIRRGVS